MIRILSFIELTYGIPDESELRLKCKCIFTFCVTNICKLLNIRANSEMEEMFACTRKSDKLNSVPSKITPKGTLKRFDFKMVGQKKACSRRLFWF